MKNMSRYLYQLCYTKKNSGAKIVLLIIHFNFIAETLAIEALPVELHLMFVMVTLDMPLILTASHVWGNRDKVFPSLARRYRGYPCTPNT